MKHALNQFFIHFLKKNTFGNAPILIAFSGGADSRALLELFLDCRGIIINPIHVIHVDHSWRSSSAQEAALLAQLALKHHLGWHLKTLDPSDFTGASDEDRARQMRYAFFQKIYVEIGAEALFIAHHRDDLAETVLKRVFEGASLSHLAGMEEEGMFQGMRVIRPLLSRPKQELLHFLEQKGIGDFIVDPTNVSDENLRGKMRAKIIPFLQEQFGKDISSSLASLSKESALLKQSDAQYFRPYIDKVIQTRLGWVVCKEDLEGLDPSKLFHFLRYMFEKRNLPIGRILALSIAKAYGANAIGRRFSYAGVNIFVEGNYLLVMQKSLPQLSCEHLRVGSYLQGGWTVETKVAFAQEVITGKKRWILALQGSLYCEPVGPKDRLIYLRDIADKKIKKEQLSQFSTNKVPSVLRDMFPLLLKESGQISNFLVDLNAGKIKSDFFNFLIICFK